MSKSKSDGDNNAYGLGDINKEMDNNHLFNQLLDDPPNECHHHDYLFGIDDDNIERDDNDDLCNALYNKDFWLPDDQNQAPGVVLPHF